MPSRRFASLGLAAAFLASSCAGPVEVAPAPEGTSAACATVASVWPETVAEAPRTTVEPQQPSTMAWRRGNDPAIIARCGVQPPGPTTLECIAVDDADWVAEKLDDGMRFTTYGRVPAIEVLVPNRYSPEPLVLSALAEPVRRAKASGHRCT